MDHYPPRMTFDRNGDNEITALALAAGQGDRSALERFIRATQRDVWRFLAHLDSPPTADDLAQETYLRALRALPRFTGRAPARMWLLSIARRVAVDQVRRARARPKYAQVDDWQGTAERAQPRNLPGFDEGIALGDLLNRLADERREAFVLTQVLRLSYAEAAEVCQCPVGTIRSRVARAREDLVVLLDDSGDENTGHRTG